jgi:pimeloyl-ACP methyl ester carboxylesterase
MNLARWSLAFLGIVLSLTLAAAPGRAEDKVGVVLMHGKWGSPNKFVDSLAGSLRRADFLVESPEMPWSKSRDYDRSYEEAMTEIDKAFDKLRAKGATVLVVAGHSLGANAALGYAATRPGLAGVVALAPGHTPERSVFRDKLGDSVDKARTMVAEGKGDSTASFGDLNLGKPASFNMKARIYLSYFDPDGPAVMPRNAAAIQGGIPLFVAMGREDPLFSAGRGYLFDKAPANPKSLYLEVSGGHLDTPTQAADALVAWIKGLKG